MIKRVCIVGLGLMGGSLGYAFRTRGQVDEIVGHDCSRDVCTRAVERGCVQTATPVLSEAVADADVVFVCTPIHLVAPVVRDICAHVKKGTIITDVGSTKTQIVDQLKDLPRKDVFFVGGHPMAGSDRSGIDAARPDLFQGALYFLTPVPETQPRALDELDQFIQRLTPRVEQLSPQKHDALVALASHLPFMVATALVQTFKNSQQPPLEELLNVVSTGFRDSTRVAAHPPDWGKDVVISNHENVLKELDRFLEAANELRKKIAERDEQALYQWFSEVSVFRRGMYASRPS